MSVNEDALLPVSPVHLLDQETEDQRWLIRGLWGRAACGIIGGLPKSMKTWLGLEMAVSVATAMPVFGRFPVDTPGPVLVYLAEDALTQVRCRIEGICQHKGFAIDKLPLLVITRSRLRLDHRDDQVALENTVQHGRPAMVLLDPLVRLHSLDENSSADISHLLGYFRDLQRRFDVAVVLVHHLSKRSQSDLGQALRGSGDFHAWADAAAYLKKKGEHSVLTFEHRAAESPSPMTIGLVAGQPDAPTHLAVVDTDDVVDPDAGRQPPSLGVRLLQLLADADAPLSRGAIREALRVNNQRLGDLLVRFEREGRVHRTAIGWTLPA